jgi:nucleoside 2-deoxyribosyltransferase
MVCGSIGFGGIEDIRKLYAFLESEGFSVINHLIEKGMDYSYIQDFREEKDLAKEIVTHDLEYINRADVIAVIANSPSYGTAIEMFVAKNKAKKVVLLATKPIPTPWPIHFSDYIVKSNAELIEMLHDLEKIMQ